MTTEPGKPNKTAGKKPATKRKAKRKAAARSLTASADVGDHQPGDTKCVDHQEFVWTADQGWQFTGNAC